MYRFHPRIHVSRLKLRKKFVGRPAVELLDIANHRFDFDEKLLPEDSWLQEGENVYEVEEILDVKYEKRAKNSKKQKMYLIKWKGYSMEDCTWEPTQNLSCGALLYEFDKRKMVADHRLSMVHLADEGEPMQGIDSD